MQRKRVLFLCTGNSCRSQMAEAFVNARMGDRWQAFSAGVEPENRVNPYAIEALAEIGIEHEGETKSADRFKGQDFDLVVTLCDDAEENCPVWLGKGGKEHLSFPDPALVRGNPEKVQQVYRDVLNGISTKVPLLLQKSETNTT